MENDVLLSKTDVLLLMVVAELKQMRFDMKTRDDAFSEAIIEYHSLLERSRVDPSLR